MTDKKYEEMYDVAIIGTGPAGLSAALNMKIRNKSMILIGNKNSSRKVNIASEVNNYLGFHKIKGKDLADNFIKHIDEMGIEIEDVRVTMAFPMGSYYSLQTSENQILNAKSIIVATGVSFGKAYENEESFLGRGVSYCATCDAPLYKGKTVAIIAATKKEEAEANFMAEVAGTVYYIPLYKGEVEVSSKIQVIKDIPKAILGGMKVETLELENQSLSVDGVFILRDSIAPAQLIPGLKVVENYIEVNRKMETNLAGCFACGDIVGRPYQYIKAAGEGNVAALSAVAYLDELEK